MKSEHSIIIIKNDEGEYLQYYDKDWECYLFPNCKYNKKINDNEFYTFLGKREHRKYSVKDKVDKDYIHYFYKFNGNIDIVNLCIDITTCKWFSYQELLNDIKIQEINADIVQFVKELEEENVKKDKL